MLQQNPEIAAFDKKLVSSFERKIHRRHKHMIGRYALASLVLAGVHTYMTDVHANQEQEAEAEISLQTIEDLGLDTSLIYFDGFNTRNADSLAEKLGPAIQQITNGNLVSVNSGDAPPDPKETADKIIDYAEENSISNISLFGYSLGGFETIKAAAYIVHNSDITIDSIYLASTPDSIDSLQPETRYQLNALTQLLARIPWSEHSSYVKFLLTLGFEKEVFMPGNDVFESLGNFDLEAFQQSWDSSVRIVRNNERPGVSALEYQIDLARTDIKNDINRIAEIEGEGIVPPIVYLKITNPGSDNTVDNERSSEQFCLYADDVEIPCTIVTVPGSHHAQYYTTQAVDAYSDALKGARASVLEAIEHQEALFAATKWNGLTKPSSNESLLSPRTSETNNKPGQ